MTVEPGNPPHKRLPGWLVPTICYVVSIVSLIWVFKDFKLKEALEDFVALDWRFVTIAVVSDLSIYLCGGWRWTVLLRPVAPAGFWRAVQAIYIGLYANEILPLRPGELIRCYLLGLWNDIPMSMALSSAAIERILEGVWLVLGFAVATLFIELPAAVERGAMVLAVLIGVLAGLIGLIASRRVAVEWASQHPRLPESVRLVIRAVHGMGNRRTIAIASLASLVYLILQIVPVWALMQGYGLDLSIWAASAVLIIIRLGTVIPSLPGNAGLYQAMCIVGLRLFGVTKTTAVGFSLMMFGVLTLPLLIGGFIAVLLSGLKLDDIRARANSSMRTPMQLPSD